MKIKNLAQPNMILKTKLATSFQIDLLHMFLFIQKKEFLISLPTDIFCKNILV